MTLETVPLVLGALVLLTGLGLLADGWMPDSGPRTTERRRRARTERNRPGEMTVGAGLLLVAAALFGRDGWRYSTVAVLGGGLLMLVGCGLNARYLVERLTFRGAARRGRSAEDRRHLGDSVAPAPDARRRSNDRRWTDRRGSARGPSPADQSRRNGSRGEPASGRRAPPAPPPAHG